jgi:DNA-binding MarR family transcriptional regulator
MQMNNMQSNTNSGEDGFVDSYLLYLLAQASSECSAAFHAELAELGVPVSTWRVLASLFPGKALNVGELAQRCLAKQSTLSRQLERMEADGLIARAHERRDRRAVLVRLTSDGQDLAAQLVARAKSNEAEVLRDYPPAQIDALKALLSDLAERARADSVSRPGR